MGIPTACAVGIFCCQNTPTEHFDRDVPANAMDLQPAAAHLSSSRTPYRFCLASKPRALISLLVLSTSSLLFFFKSCGFVSLIGRLAVVLGAVHAGDREGRPYGSALTIVAIFSTSFSSTAMRCSSVGFARLQAEMYFLPRTCRDKKWIESYFVLADESLRGCFMRLCQ